jgi:hypothetical protein
MKGSTMHTPLEVESLLANPRPLSAAANDEFVSADQPTSGWDPFEVWRTRVKTKIAQDALKTPVTVVA